MNILITGVLGVIGAPLALELRTRGHRVFGVDLAHTNKAYSHNLGQRLDDEYCRCDIGEFRQLERVVEYAKPELIYNCAAEFGRWNGEHYYEQVWRSNVVGLKHIIRLQEKLRYRLVHCSSSEVYGDYGDVMYEDVLSERPLDQLNDYAMSKRVNELQIQNSRTQFDTESVVVRLFNTYGPGEKYHPFRSANCIFTYNLLAGRPITVFQGHTRTSTYIDDCVRTLANVATSFKSGQTYNIASTQVHTMKRLAELVIDETGASRSLVQYAEHHEVLTTTSKLVDASKAIADLDHSNTVSLQEGVRNTVAWMREYYGL